MFHQVLHIGRRMPLLLSTRCMSQSPMQGQGKNYTPTNFEKKILVWTGKYKTIEEIPRHVSSDVMERSVNKMRIRIANYMMGLTIFGCVIMVYSGKQAAKRGETVSKQNLDWHQKYNEQNAAKETKE